MKKLLFVLAFTFIGQQAFTQMYIVTICQASLGGCSSSSNSPERTLTTVTPTGIETHTCIKRNISDGALIELNEELNIISSQGYKLIESNYGGIGIIGVDDLNIGTMMIFAIP